jgi:HEAT repeat protein
MAPLRVPSVILLASLLAGCCSYEEADFVVDEAAAKDEERTEDRREALACLVEDAETDRELRSYAIATCERLLRPDVEPSAAVRATAVRGLGHLKVSAARPLLIAVLREDPDPHPLVRNEALRALTRLGGTEATATYRGALREDADRDVRLAAAHALGAGGEPSPDTTEALIAGLRDSSVEVRLNARRSLSRLHDCDHGLSADRWQAWWEDAALELEPGAETDEEAVAEEDGWPDEEPALEEREPEPEPEPEPGLPPEEEFPAEELEPFEDEVPAEGAPGGTPPAEGE